ncbi:hypothetical protein FALBO_1693 [Fusarium albosuccineum]|uniref:Uncharacterized protein n=1 Tax=Fusarium albosuccineum TaxID=1237068 RepID=A0A8H4PLV6_9HYPO|nr:hypothetical protein FALBO_1693 [Fusarium albosuccineum]
MASASRVFVVTVPPGGGCDSPKLPFQRPQETKGVRAIPGPQGLKRANLAEARVSKKPIVDKGSPMARKGETLALLKQPPFILARGIHTKARRDQTKTPSQKGPIQTSSNIYDPGFKPINHAHCAKMKMRPCYLPGRVVVDFNYSLSQTRVCMQTYNGTIKGAKHTLCARPHTHIVYNQVAQTEDGGHADAHTEQRTTQILARRSSHSHAVGSRLRRWVVGSSPHSLSRTYGK